jgi:hypothetical protein
MRTGALWILLVSAAVSSCSDGTSPPPTPAGPSGDLTVDYIAGGQVAFTINQLWVGKGFTLPTPTDTIWCAGINVVGSTPDVPFDPAHPQLQHPNAGFCADSAKNFPIRYDDPMLGGDLDDNANVNVSSPVGSYHADSGTVHVEPLGGGYAQIDVDAWFHSDGDPSTHVFRLHGRLVAADSVPTAPI